MTTIAIIMGDFLPTLSQIIEQKTAETNFFLYIPTIGAMYCSRLHTHVLYY